MKTLTICLACVGLSLLTGCQSTGSSADSKNMEVEQQASYFSAAKTLLDKLQQDIAQGKEDELAYFAPSTFKQALAELDDASEEYEDIVQNGASSLNVFKTAAEQYKEAKADIINAITLANQHLKLAYSNKEIVQSTLATTFIQNTILQDIGTPKVFANDYKKISARLGELVEYIDEGKLTTAQDKQPKLLTDMHVLEVRTVRKNSLGQLDADIALIKNKDLAKGAPLSLQQLLTARSNANAIITATPRAKDDITAAVKLADFELAHLYHITKEVKTLNNTESKEYEQYLLAKENELHTITESLDLVDLRDLAMTTQVESIALQAGTIQDKLTTANAAVLALQSDSTASSEATQSLRAEFKSQLVNLSNKYDALVIENSSLNKELQDRGIELLRLKVYKEAVMQVESKHEAEKELALQAKAKREAEQKVLAQQAQANKDVEQVASAQQEQVAVQTVAVSLAEQPIKAEEIFVDVNVDVKAEEVLTETIVPAVE